MGEEFSLADATADYKKMIKDLDEVGPLTRAGFMAKAYGVLNSGAAGFEMIPTYNDNSHLFSRTLFMNNYGVRTMPPESPFHTWTETRSRGSASTQSASTARPPPSSARACGASRSSSRSATIWRSRCVAS